MPWGLNNFRHVSDWAMLSIEHWHQQMQFLHWIHSKEKLGVNKVFWQLWSSFESQMGNLSLQKTSFPQACMVSINVGLQEVLQKAAWLLCSKGSKSSLCSFPWNSCFSADTGQQPKQRIMPKKRTIPTSFRSLSIYIYIYILFICLNFHLDTSEISKKSQWRFHPSRAMGCAIYSSVSAGSKWLGRASRVSMWTSGSMARRVLPVAALLALWRRSMDLDGSTLGCPKELSKLPAGSAPGVSLSKLTERSSQKHFVGGQDEKTKSKTAQNLQSGQWLDRFKIYIKI